MGEMSQQKGPQTHSLKPTHSGQESIKAERGWKW